MTVYTNLFTVPTIPILPQHPYKISYTLLGLTILKMSVIKRRNLYFRVGIHKRDLEGMVFTKEMKIPFVNMAPENLTATLWES